METFSAETFLVWMAMLGLVIVASALLSGLVDRTGFPHIAVFLGFGAALGPHGLGLLEVGLDSPFLRVVGTLSLTLVLFTDAVSLNVAEVRRHGRLALRLLGPGTLLSAALMALAAWHLPGVSLPMALVLGAALASTDPVLLRGLLRRSEVPATARLALRLESGLNDVVLLPIVAVALTIAASSGAHGMADWAKLGLDLFVLGPGAGVLVGLAGIGLLEWMRGRVGVRRDYESLYSLGLAFAAFAAAESMHASGFLAAFAAGLTISALDVELCDCFLEYGEVTAEMLLLLTFVLFGASLIWTGLDVLAPVTAAFVVFALLVRPPVYLLSLAGSGLERRSAWLIAWFGGRGLSSLLLVLLAVFAGFPESVQIFRICCAVVLLSILVHGGSSMVVLAWSARRAVRDEAGRLHAPAPEPHGACALPAAPAWAADAASGERPVPTVQPADRQFVTLEELRGLQAAGEPLAIVDARSERTYEPSPIKARGAVRLHPDAAVRQAKALGLPHDAWLAVYCA